MPASTPKTPETLLCEVVEIADPIQRGEYLDRHCGGDQDLRRNVESMVVDYFAAGSLLDPPVMLDQTTNSSQATEALTQIDNFKLREQIGEGGMGVVYVADQIAPVKRRVALKLIKPGLDSKQVVARFESERQALAMMDHPNIAKILDGGTTTDGRPYFVMELVKGVPINEFCESRDLDNQARLELFIKVCAAVEHAHQKGIIHRDLKPNNILVTMHDDDAVPKVIDFGIAKATGQSLSDNTVYTAFAQLIGTPLYMSPEQSEMNNLDVDTRSDVYSLGVVLYQLLTGTTPFNKETLERASFDELRRIIQEDAPVRPSRRISTLAVQNESTSRVKRGVDKRRISKALSGELDWIVLKALEKDRRRRYQSARDFADDIRRYLSNEPVEACPPSVSYQLKKYVTRNRHLLTAVGIVLLTAIVGTVVSLQYAGRANLSATTAKHAKQRAEDLAEEAQQLAQVAKRETLNAERSSLKAKAAAAAAVEAKARETIQLQLVEQALYVSDTRLAASQINSNLHLEAYDSLLKRVPLDAKQADLRGWEWYFLLGHAKQNELTWKASRDEISRADWSPNGEFLATVGDDGDCRVWDASTGKLIKEWHLGHTIKKSVKWSPDSRLLAWGSASDESILRIWDREADEITELSPLAESIWTIAWSKDQSRILLGSIPGVRITDEDKWDGKNLVVYDWSEEHWKIVRRESHPSNITLFDWNHDESLIGVFGEWGPVRIYSNSAFKLLSEPTRQTTCGQWASTTNRVAFGNLHGECMIYDVDQQQVLTRFQASFGKLRSLAWSDDDRWLATCGNDGTVMIWDSSDWTLHRSFRGHAGIVNSVTWHPDSKRLASVGLDGIINVWTLEESMDYLDLDTSTEGNDGAFVWSHDRKIRFIKGDTSLVETDVTTGQTRLLDDLTPTANGKNWILGKQDSADPPLEANILLSATGDHWREVAIKNQLELIVENPISNELAVSPGRQTQPFILDPLTAIRIPISDQEFLYCSDFSWSPTASLLAIAGNGLISDNGIAGYAAWLYVVDSKTGEVQNRTRVGDARVDATACAWSPDGNRLVAASENGTCAVYQRDKLLRIVSRPKHRAGVNSLSWHPSGNRIASAGDDRVIHIWDASNGETLVTLPMESAIQQVAWSPDGNMLAAKDVKGHFRIWDATRGYQIEQSNHFATRMESLILARFSDAVTVSDWATAREALERLLQRSTKNINAVFLFWSVLLAANDQDQITLARDCEQIIGEFKSTTVQLDAFFTAWTCALAPAGLRDYGPAILLARQAVRSDPKGQQAMNGLGAILMRAGQYDEATQRLESVLMMQASNQTSTTYTLYFLAMTQHHLGNHDAAHTLLANANAATETELSAGPVWNRRLTIELLRNEANALIGEDAPQ